MEAGLGNGPHVRVKGRFYTNLFSKLSKKVLLVSDVFDDIGYDGFTAPL